MTAPTEQEVIPYDVLLPQMEAELHRRDSQIVMLNARLEMRDRKITQLEARLGAVLGPSANGSAQGPQQQLGQQHVELPPPADQQPVPDVGAQRPAVVPSS